MCLSQGFPDKLQVYIGNSFYISIFWFEVGPFLNLFKWIIRIGGNLQIPIFFTAVVFFLHSSQLQSSISSSFADFAMQVLISTSFFMIECLSPITCRNSFNYLLTVCHMTWIVTYPFKLPESRVSSKSVELGGMQPGQLGIEQNVHCRGSSKGFW